MLSSSPLDEEGLSRKSEQEGTATLLPPDEGDIEVFPPPNVTLPKRTTIIMEPLTVLFCFAFQGLNPLISQYAYYRIGREMGLPAPNNSAQASSTCNVSDRYADGGNASALYVLTEQVQDRTSTLILYRDVAVAATAAIGIPLLSSASDRIGRRVALILPCFGNLLESLITLSVIYFELPLELILAAAALSGFFGSIGCLFAVSLAYLADITPIKSRPLRITVLEAVTGLSSVPANILIGWWIRFQGYLFPHIFCSALYLVVFLSSVFLVPEVRKPLISNEPSAGRIATAWRLFTDPVRGLAILLSRPYGLPLVYILVLSSSFLYCAAYYGTGDLTILYSMNYPFCLDSVFIGYFSAVRQLVQQIGMTLIVGLFHPALSTLTIAWIGMLSTALSYMLLGVAWNQLLLWISQGAALIAGTPVPMYRAFLSIITPADKQGCMYSAFGVLQMVAYLLGTVAFTYGYKATLLWQPGFVFYTVAATLLVGLCLTVAAELFYLRRTRPAMTAAAAAAAAAAVSADSDTGRYPIGTVQAVDINKCVEVL